MHMHKELVMKVEAVVPVPEFRFDGAAASPPTRPVAAHGDEPSLGGLTIRRPSFSTSSTVPFVWEDKPGTPIDHRNADGDHLDFSFKFHARHRANREALTAADELFAEGKIRPLKPPPRLQRPVIADELSSSVCSSPGSPGSPRRKAMRSPHRKGRGGGGEEFDPFMAAMVETTKDKVESALSTSRSRKGSSTPNSSGKRWRRLKDLLLFRGAAAKMSKELIMSKYSLVSLFKSRSPSAGPTANEKTMPPHEKRNGMAQEVKKEAAAAAAPPLVPYRQRLLLSCFRVNPAIHSVDGGFNRYSFSRMECE